MKIQTERSNLMELISKTISELKLGSFDTLVASVAETKNTQEKIQEIIQREKDATETVQRLDQELTREKAEHQTQVEQQKKLVASLQEQLLQLKV